MFRCVYPSLPVGWSRGTLFLMPMDQPKQAGSIVNEFCIQNGQTPTETLKQITVVSLGKTIVILFSRILIIIFGHILSNA